VGFTRIYLIFLEVKKFEYDWPEISKIKEIGSMEIQEIVLQSPVESIIKIFDKDDFCQHYLLAT